MLRQRRRLAGVGTLLFLFTTYSLVQSSGSDHSDAPVSLGVTRQDANLTDLHAFVAGPNLVLALSTNPAIPKSATSYIFPNDVTFTVNIDMDSAIDSFDPYGDGGSILEPHRISEDVSLRIRFQPDGSVRLQRVVQGTMRDDAQIVNFFAGLRDDPFIRGPRQGRNVGAIVLETPLAPLTGNQTTLLIWATSKVDEFDGTFQELAGRSLRSMFPEQRALNAWHPRLHLQQTGLRPDVMIYNTALPAAFPNGRALTDDVVNLVGDPRVLGNDDPFPSTNDLPFLTTFPYLAPPHTP
jgi:hypothetical protein